MVVIHGGGFNDGDKARPREINFATNLVANGYVVMSINYKLRKRQGEVTWPQPVLDAKARCAGCARMPTRSALIRSTSARWVVRRAAIFPPCSRSPARRMAFDEKQPYGEFSSRVSCGVDFYGAVKLLEYHDMKMFAKTRAEAPELYEKAIAGKLRQRG